MSQKALRFNWAEEGLTPPKANVPALLQFAEDVADGQTWASNRLSTAHPSAAEYANDVR